MAGRAAGRLPVLQDRGGGHPGDASSARRDTTVAFRDINPQAPTHVLVIPKVHYPDAASLAAGDPRSPPTCCARRARSPREEKIDDTATASSSTPARAPARPSSTRTPTSWAAAASSGPPDRPALSVT